VLGIPVRTVPGDAAVTGVAMLAGLGAGVYRDEAEAVARCVRPSAAVLPDPATSDVHALGFARHLELAESAAVRR
jgi:sugar (pentulose or hexulose) kinase